MKIAVVGATGLVGHVMLKVLEEHKFPVSELILAASQKSVGKELEFKSKKIKVISVEDAIAAKPQIALFSAGGSTSLKYAPRFAENGTFVIDNSSAWRMNENVKLIVPEINGATLTNEDKIIANPNCSTIQLVMALAPLHDKYKIKRVVVSTYQSVSGSGIDAVNQLYQERENQSEINRKYPHPIDLNCLPHCDVFLDNDYTKEEMKLVNETKKILDDYLIRLTATAVRVPVKGGHSESVNVEFGKDFDIYDIQEIYKSTRGVVLQDDPENNVYPMPINAEGKDEVFVGRLRRDYSQEKCLNMWIVADNLYKGAATNAVQIAEFLVEKNIVK